MFNAMKRDLSNFRHEMVSNMSRQDRDRQTVATSLQGLEGKVEEAQRQLTEVADSCVTIEQTLREEVNVKLTREQEIVTRVDENVLGVHDNLNAYDEAVSTKLRDIEGKVSDNINKMLPIMEALTDIQSRVRRLATEEVGGTLTHHVGHVRSQVPRSIPQWVPKEQSAKEWPTVTSNNNSSTQVKQSGKPYSVKISRVPLPADWTKQEAG